MTDQRFTAACHAMQGFCANLDMTPNDHKKMALFAVEQGDALIAALGPAERDPEPKHADRKREKPAKPIRHHELCSFYRGSDCDCEMNDVASAIRERDAAVERVTSLECVVIRSRNHARAILAAFTQHRYLTAKHRAEEILCDCEAALTPTAAQESVK